MISDEFERKIVKMNISELVTYLMNENYLRREIKCVNCSPFMKLEQFYNVRDGKTWRCNYNLCTRTRTSIRKVSFFQDINLDFEYIFKILIRCADKMLITKIKTNLGKSKITIKKN